jgi:hypothetical protein
MHARELLDPDASLGDCIAVDLRPKHRWVAGSYKDPRKSKPSRYDATK